MQDLRVRRPEIGRGQIQLRPGPLGRQRGLHPIGMKDGDICRSNPLGIIDSNDQRACEYFCGEFINRGTLPEDEDRIGGVCRRDIADQARETVHHRPYR